MGIYHQLFFITVLFYLFKVKTIGLKSIITGFFPPFTVKICSILLVSHALGIDSDYRQPSTLTITCEYGLSFE